MDARCEFMGISVGSRYFVLKLLTEGKESDRYCVPCNISRLSVFRLSQSVSVIIDNGKFYWY